MDVLGGLFQFGEGSNGGTRFAGQWMVDFQEQRAVALHDERTTGHAGAWGSAGAVRSMGPAAYAPRGT